MADGSISAPFTDLRTALLNPKLKAGHTIYLRAGTHVLREDTIFLSAGVTVRPFEGEAVVIDLYRADLIIRAGLTIQDITIISSDTQRTSTQSISTPTDILAGSMEAEMSITMTNVRASGLVSLGWWTGGAGTWKGVLIQDSGWDAPNRGHGHALYMQNREADGIKRLEACIIVSSYSEYCLHVYGSAGANLSGFTFTGCITLHGGVLLGGETGSIVDAVTVQNCMMYSQIGMGSRQSTNGSAELTGCVLRELTAQRDWQSLTVSDCVFLSGDLNCLTVVLGGDLSTLHIDNNVYISSKTRPFEVDGEGWYSLAEWRTRTGLDANSRHYSSVAAAVSAGDLVAPVVRVYPVNEGSHIANIAIWNPLEDATVAVDLSSLGMANGNYELRQVRDYTGDVRAVTYIGAAVSVSMSGTTAYPPGYPTVYHPEAVPANALPTFGAFELWAV